MSTANYLVSAVMATTREHLEELGYRVHGRGRCLTVVAGNAGDVLWIFYYDDHLELQLDTKNFNGHRAEYCNPGLLDYVTNCAMLEIGPPSQEPAEQPI